MTLHIVKITQSRFGCSYRFPVMSEGKDGLPLVLREEPCFLPRGHQGPHRGAGGGVAVNKEDADRMLHGSRKLY